MTTLAELQQAVIDAPASVEALCALARALRLRREFAESIQFFRAAVRADPSSVAARLGLAESLSKTGAFEDAADAYAAALAIDPACTPAVIALSDLSVRALNRPGDTRRFGVRAIAAAPDDLGVYEAFCMAWLAGERAERAQPLAERALPREGRADLLQRGFVEALMRLGRHEDVRDLLSARVQRGPVTAAALALLARTHGVLGDAAAARARFAEVRALAAASERDFRTSAHECLQYAWRTGDYDWAHELLRRAYGTSVAGASSLVEGRSCLLRLDDGGGYGDWILWSRLAPLLHARGVRVILEARTPVKRVLETVPGVARVVVPHDEYPPIDVRTSPYPVVINALAWRLDEIHGRGPYLEVPGALVRQWRARLAAHGGGFHLGVDWKTSNDGREHDAWTRRGMPLERLRALTCLPGVHCHALHVGASGLREIAGAEPPLSITTLSTGFGDFLDTAAALAALDAVVTVDTAAGHVAGALGTPTLLMLPCYPDRRWGDADTPFPWYASVRRVHQRAPGQWEPVIGDVVQRVAEMAALRAVV